MSIIFIIYKTTLSKHIFTNIIKVESITTQSRALCLLYKKKPTTFRGPEFRYIVRVYLHQTIVDQADIDMLNQRSYKSVEIRYQVWKLSNLATFL